MMKKLTISMVLMGLMAFGCGDDDRSTDTTDDDTITIPDSGTMTTPDMGTTTTPDMGTTPTGACAENIDALPAEFFPRCSADTFTCIQGATTNDEFFACLDNDTTAPFMDMTGADCGYCVNYQSLYCADANGCHAEFAAINCCIEDNCPDTGDCTSTTCSAELAAFQACEPTSDCSADIVSCFATE